MIGSADLALTKFVIALSQDISIDDGEYITTDGHIEGKTNPYLRAADVDTSKLCYDEKCHDATYKLLNNSPLSVFPQAYVLYNIRVYNEGDLDVYAGEIIDYLPEYLNYVECDFNTKYRWKVSGEDGKKIITDYLSYEQGAERNLIKAFDREIDDGKGSGLDYKDLQVLCRVSDKASINTKLANLAEISIYQDEEGKFLSNDIDSKTKNAEQQNEDDDNYEKIIIQNIDSSLVNGNLITGNEKLLDKTKVNIWTICGIAGAGIVIISVFTIGIILIKKYV